MDLDPTKLLRDSTQAVFLRTDEDEVLNSLNRTDNGTTITILDPKASKELLTPYKTLERVAPEKLLLPELWLRVAENFLDELKELIYNSNSPKIDSPSLKTLKAFALTCSLFNKLVLKNYTLFFTLSSQLYQEGIRWGGEGESANVVEAIITTLKESVGKISNDKFYCKAVKLMEVVAALGKEVALRTALEKANVNLNAKDANKKILLHEAAKNGSVEAIKMLVRIGAKVAAKDSLRYTPLHKAASAGHCKAIETLVELGAELDAKRDLGGDTSLHGAASKGHCEAIKRLVKLGAELNARNHISETPLHKAASAGHYGAIKTLVELGAEVDAKDIVGCTPLHRIVADGIVPEQQYRYEAIETLVELGAEVNAKNNKDDTPLHAAASKGGCEAIETLVELGAEVNAKNVKGATPLHAAACSGECEAIKRLVNLGAEADKMAFHAIIKTATCFLRMIGFYYKALKLLEVMEWIATFLGEAALQIAFKQTRTKLNDIKDKTDFRHLHKKANRQEAMEALTKLENDINSYYELGPNSYIVAEIIRAFESKSYDEAIELIEVIAALEAKETLHAAIKQAGIDINATDDLLGCTLLHFAADRGSEKAIKLLLELGADVNAIDIEGYAALHNAAVKGHSEVILLLLSANAAINVKTEGGNTPLQCAAMNGNTEVVELLLTAGAEADVQDQGGDTPLHSAAKDTHIAVVKCLLDAGATVNAKNSKNLTPLHKAAINGSVEVIKLLLAAGADSSAQSNTGATPLAYANIFKKQEAAALLK